MKRIIRSTCWTDQTEKVQAAENYKHLQPDRLSNLSSTEREVLDYLTDFFGRTGEPPQLNTVFNHFEGLNNAQATTLTEEATAEQFYAGASFQDLFEKEVEEQAQQNLVQTCRNAVKIATQGTTIGNTTVQGADAAVAYLFSEARGTPKGSDGKMNSNMRANKDALTNMYKERKANPHQTYGALTGYGLFDSATAGIKKKQLYLHAGFGGHLKSTHMFNMMVNAATDGGWNVLLFTSEMPAPDVQQLLIAIHSANPVFNGVGRPLSSFRLLLGGLKPDEETFYETVKDDLLTNNKYGSLRVIDSAEFTSFGSIMQRTTREHMEEEVDVLWLDYLTRLPLDVKYQRMETTAARNETIAEAKRFAMSFDQGKGLPVCTPFQVNREGFKRAKTNGGRMDKTALAQYNAAEKEADVITYIFYDEEEAATSEPKVGVLKCRWGKVNPDPVAVFIEPDSRRIFDLTAGMGITTGYAPTGTTGEAAEEVEL